MARLATRLTERLGIAHPILSAPMALAAGGALAAAVTRAGGLGLIGGGYGDGAWLEHALAGIDAEVGYQHGLDEVLATLADGTAAAAVLIRPTSLEEIRRTAREGLLMPPKSTFFTPKLRTGLVIRPSAALGEQEARVSSSSLW